MRPLTTPIGKFVAILLLGVAISAPAHATYDADCMRYFIRTQAEDDAMVAYRKETEPRLVRVYHLNRFLNEVEFEALMDATYGLAFTARFDNGQMVPVFPGRPNIDAFARRLNKREAVGVVYFPETLARVGQVYLQACALLQRHPCAVYSDYPGLGAGAQRPFTPVQEQVLKWSTLHQMPPPDLAGFPTDPAAEEYLLELLIKSQYIHHRKAQYLIESSFSPLESALLLNDLIDPYIVAAYENILRQIRRERPH